jgi:hypothetical protein
MSAGQPRVKVSVATGYSESMMKDVTWVVSLALRKLVGKFLRFSGGVHVPEVVWLFVGQAFGWQPHGWPAQGSQTHNDGSPAEAKPQILKAQVGIHGRCSWECETLRAAGTGA